MKKTALLGAISGALVAGSLALAGPAFAHDGRAGDGSAAPGAGQSSSAPAAGGTSVGSLRGGLSSPQGQIGVGIFTNPAAANPAASGGLTSGQPNSFGSSSHAMVGMELPIAPVGTESGPPPAA